MADVVIVGAGPAGIAAADVLVSNGIAPIILDEGARPGGQAYRTSAPCLGLDLEALLGSEAPKYRRVHDTFARVRPACDYRSGTTVWAVFDRDIYVQDASGAKSIRFDALLLATGATDRVLPVPGWTLPGVFTLGGAQVLLKDQGCLIGRRAVFCGSSPLLYLAALQFKSMGGEIAAVLDTTPFRSKLAALNELVADRRTLWRGLTYMARLKLSRVPLLHGVQLHAFEGKSSVSGATYSLQGGPPQTIACDAVAFGFGLKPETQLAQIAGCRLAYDPVYRQWLPDADEDGRCGNGIYVAGDGAKIGGADAAEVSGALVAHAIVKDLGLKPAKKADLAGMRRKLARLHRFQRGLARAFAWPADAIPGLPDDVTLCRCENVKVGELRRALAVDLGPREINRAKALTRCGMGRCQGRFCGLAAAELISATLRVPLQEVGYLRAQAPVKPLVMSAAER